MNSKQSDPSTWNRPTYEPPEGEEMPSEGVALLPMSDEEVEEIFAAQPRVIVDPPASEEEVKELFEQADKGKHKGKH